MSLVLLLISIFIFTLAAASFPFGNCTAECHFIIFTGTFDSTNFPNNESTAAPRIEPDKIGCFCDLACRNSGDCCNNYVELCASPNITSIDPKSSNTSPGSTDILTITGVNLSPNHQPANVLIGSYSCLVITTSDTEITCQIPRGIGANLSVIINCPTPLGELSAVSNLLFSYNLPSVTSCNPNQGINSGDIINVTGSNFGEFVGPISILSNDVVIAHAINLNENFGSFTFLAPNTIDESLVFYVQVGNQKSLESSMLNYINPIISDILPLKGPTCGNTTILLYGSSIGLDTQAYFNEILVKSGCNSTCCLFQSLSGYGSVNIYVKNGNRKSQNILFGYHAPSIDSIEFNSSRTLGGDNICLIGWDYIDKITILKLGSTNYPIEYLNSSRICFISPPGTGRNIPLSVSNGDDESNIFSFNYSSPSIDYTLPAKLSTSGGEILTIVGNNFGTIQNTIVLIGNSNCLIHYISVSQNEINCISPAGQGLINSIKIDVSGQSVERKSINYSAPIIYKFSPTSDYTSGGATMFIEGDNFGTSGTVTIGLDECSPAIFYHKNITCTIPSGMGINLGLVVEVGNQKCEHIFSYVNPQIISVFPISGPRIGIEITILGLSFGQELSEKYGQVLIGAYQCLPSFWDDFKIICKLQPGDGLNLPVSIITYRHQLSNVNITFSYDPPKIISVFPPTAPTSGIINATLIGLNFGDRFGQLKMIESVSHSSVLSVLFWNDSYIIFNIPPGVGTDFNIQLDTSSNIDSNLVPFHYDPPVIASFSPTSSNVTAYEILTINGNNFGLIINTPVVYLGSFSCPVLNNNHIYITCKLPSGRGKNLIISVTVGAQTGTSVTNFNYEPPNIQLIYPDSGNAAGGFLITITGSNFGLDSSTVTVLTGTAMCSITLISDNQIICLTALNDVGSVLISVEVSNQISNSLLFTFVGPTITSINSNDRYPTSGGSLISIIGDLFKEECIVEFNEFALLCSYVSKNLITFILPSGQGSNIIRVIVDNVYSNNYYFIFDKPTLISITGNSPTTGGSIIQFIGNNFGKNGIIYIFDAECKSVSQADTLISCTSPIGQGENLAISIKVGADIFSLPNLTFNYTQPSITSITPETFLTDGGIPITISGLNFGTHGLITIGTDLCDPIIKHLDEQIICYLPSGKGKNLDLTVNISFQTSSFKFSYLPPTLFSVFPLSGSTTGGDIITVIGKSFGTSDAIIVFTPFSSKSNPSPISYTCDVISQNSTMILCSTKASEVGQVNVHVEIANQISNDGIFAITAPPKLFTSLQLFGFGIIFIVWSLFTLYYALKSSYNIILNFDSFPLIENIITEFQNIETIVIYKISLALILILIEAAIAMNSSFGINSLFENSQSKIFIYFYLFVFVSELSLYLVLIKSIPSILTPIFETIDKYLLLVMYIVFILLSPSINIDLFAYLLLSHTILILCFAMNSLEPRLSLIEAFLKLFVGIYFLIVSTHYCYDLKFPTPVFSYSEIAENFLFYLFLSFIEFLVTSSMLIKYAIKNNPRIEKYNSISNASDIQLNNNSDSSMINKKEVIKSQLPPKLQPINKSKDMNVIKPKPSATTTMASAPSFSKSNVSSNTINTVLNPEPDVIKAIPNKIPKKSEDPWDFA